MDKERIKECIKMLCYHKKVNVDFDEILIDFKICRNNLFSNITNITEYVEVSSKDKKIQFLAGGDVESEIIAEQALLGFLREKQKYFKQEESEEREHAYKKKHPILSFFKY